MKECRICGRNSTEEDLCEYHSAAYAGLKSVFEKWAAVVEGLTWEKYVDSVRELENTGQWVREIIDDIRSQDDS